MAYSKQNFQDGQILTAANLEKMENGIIAGQGAKNLLVNSNFMNPINSKGKSSYSTAGNEYTIDKWKTQYNTGLTIENGYINVIGGWQIYQAIKNPKDGVYTFAVEARINSIGDYTPNMDISGKIETSFGTNVGEWKIHILQYDLSTITDETITLSIAARGGSSSGSISVRWAALYKGSYTVDTLPDYVPKGKHVEMLSCNVPLAPRNLLDNSDFRNPVNQRGQTTYTGSRQTIDRWRTWNNDATITLTSEGIKGDGTDASVLYQGIELHKIKLGTAYTVAAGYSDGTISCGAGTLTTSNSVGTWNSEAQVCLLWSDGSPFVRLWHATKTIQWMVIYPGSYDASTLPAYQPKGYAAELAECQRYYRTMPYPVIPCANNPAGTQVYGFLPFRMRIDNPTVSCDTLYYFKGDSSFYTVSSASAASYGTGTRIIFNLSSNVEGNLAGAVAGIGITLSADL